MRVVGAVLFAWDVSATLGDRFAAARDAVAAMFPSRRRPGTDPQGFLRTLCRPSADLLAIVTTRLRRCVRRVAGRSHWRTAGRWATFGVDGSRVECPRTAANEAALGCAGREKTGPQLFVTSVFHVGTGLLWDFRRGTGKASERHHLLEMLDALPAGAMLLELMAADALGAAGHAPARFSIARALRPVRRAIATAASRHSRGPTLAEALGAATRDDHPRLRPKAARSPINKKRDRPPDDPVARMATEGEIARARALMEERVAA